MIDLKALVLNFSVIVTPQNIITLKRLFNSTNLLQVESEEEIEIGEEIDLHFCFEGEIEKEVVSMAMLFNSDLVGKPTLRLQRE